MEAANSIKGLNLRRAQQFLKNVLAKKEIVPFRKFTGCVGRKAQTKQHKHSQGRWPEKSARYLLDLLENAESNADVKGLDVDTLVVSHIQVNAAPNLRRRTYRAHGRINPYMTCPSHIELYLAPKVEIIKKPVGGHTQLTTKLQQGVSGFSQ